MAAVPVSYAQRVHANRTATIRTNHRTSAWARHAPRVYPGAMPKAQPKPRTGFILVEALIALLILAVVFVALEGSLTLSVRTLANAERETIAARLAESQRERAFAGACAAASGADSADAVTVEWTTSPNTRLVRVVETSRYERRTGSRTVEYDAIGRCQ